MSFDRNRSDGLFIEMFIELLSLLEDLYHESKRFDYSDYVNLRNDITQLYDSFLEVGEGWISVEDRLPERDERVLAYSSVMADTEAAIQIIKGFSLHHQKRKILFTHWRPLPQPPEQE